MVTLSKLYDLLAAKVGNETAQTLTSYVEDKISSEFSHHSTFLASKEDLANTKFDIIKWMFLFWIGQVAVTFGFIMLYLKK